MLNWPHGFENGKSGSVCVEFNDWNYYCFGLGKFSYWTQDTVQRRRWPYPRENLLVDGFHTVGNIICYWNLVIICFGAQEQQSTIHRRIADHLL